MYIVDINEIIAEFLDSARNEMPQDVNNTTTKDITVIQDPTFRRLKSSINMQLALKKYNTYRYKIYINTIMYIFHISTLTDLYT